MTKIIPSSAQAIQPFRAGLYFRLSRICDCFSDLSGSECLKRRGERPVKARPCLALHADRSMLRPFVQHIEAFFGQEIREISCKAILDSRSYAHSKMKTVQNCSHQEALSRSSVLLVNTQNNGKISGHRHPCFAIPRSPGDGVPPILQTRGSLEPRQDHDGSFIHKGASEGVAAPRYPATAIDLARLILSRREAEMRPHGS
jgi:hypothetical protein